MNYKKMWRTLKAESGYRETINFGYIKDLTIRELMERQERGLSTKKKEVK